MLDWMIRNQMNLFGTLCMVGALINMGVIASTVYYVGGLVLYGMQALINEIRKERTLKFEPISVEKGDE